jgi:hypothetical protein
MARKLFEARRGDLIAIAERLRDVGTMAGDDLRALLGVLIGPPSD